MEDILTSGVTKCQRNIIRNIFCKTYLNHRMQHTPAV